VGLKKKARILREEDDVRKLTEFLFFSFKSAGGRRGIKAEQN